MEQSLIDLLYLYDCVVIPDFGGFVARRVAAHLENGVYQPPTKQISFNFYLKTQDGLLANHIAQKNNCTYERANEIIVKKVTQWLERLQNGASVEIKNIGVIVRNGKNALTFTPFENTNYLTDAFGLLPLSVPDVMPQKSTATTPVVFRYAAVIALSFGVGLIWKKDAIFSLRSPENTDKAVIFTEANQKKQPPKIKTIKKQTVKQPLKKTTLTSPKTHIAVGAFREKQNAHKQAHLVKNLGFDSHIVPLKNKSMFRVVITVPKAQKTKSFKFIKKKINKNAWILSAHFKDEE